MRFLANAASPRGLKLDRTAKQLVLGTLRAFVAKLK
jgi:hypothetical protein